MSLRVNRILWPVGKRAAFDHEKIKAIHKELTDFAKDVIKRGEYIFCYAWVEYRKFDPKHRD